MARTEVQQAKIDRINELVRRYKEEGCEDSIGLLLVTFDPFLKKQCNKWSQVYKGVHPWDHIVTEAQLMFYELTNEYTIGGEAYFNVFIMKKLPFRLRYFFIKEIKRRQRDLSHSEEQFLEGDLIGAMDDMAGIADDMEQSERLVRLWNILGSELVTPRERDIIIRNVLHQESQESIAQGYGISRSRVSRIIKSALDRMREEAYLNEPMDWID
jgi:RNA polymerase sigma factor (sigma-70 family)